MQINLQDTSTIVRYIQMFLKEYSGLGVKKLTGTRVQGIYTDDTYVISMNAPLSVTGTYDIETYRAIAVYMAYNYPEEGFPNIWTLDIGTDIWSKSLYDVVRLTNTMNVLISRCCEVLRTYDINPPIIDETILDESREEGQEYPEYTLFYDEILNLESGDYLTWDDLLEYFAVEKDDPQGLYDFLTSKCNTVLNSQDEHMEFTDDDKSDVLVNIIIRNSTLSMSYHSVASIDERVLSYLLGEVVSPISNEDEIYRVQQMMYKNISVNDMGVFTKKMTDDVKGYQEGFLTTATDSELSGSYAGFKVTGYVDPWTEKIIRSRGAIS